MSDSFEALVLPEDYQKARAHAFPSLESLHWFIRANRTRLLEAGALASPVRRVMIHPASFDGVAMVISKERLQKRRVERPARELATQ